MEAPERGALMLVRIIAVALISWTTVELALYWVVTNHNHTPMKISACLIRALPLLLGIIVFIKSKSLAHWVSDLLDG
jgi:small-conductance mechanosensitive channel